MRKDTYFVRLTVGSVGIFFLLLSVMLVLNANLKASLGVSLLLTTYYFLFASSEKTNGNLFHPFSFFLISGGLLSFGVPAFFATINPDAVNSLRMPTLHLPIVSVLIAFSFIMFVIGYKLPLGRVLARAIPLFVFSRRFPERQYLFSAYILYGIGWIARIAAWRLGLHHKNPDLGEATTIVSSFLQPLMIFANLSFFVLLAIYFKRAKTKRALNPFSVTVVALVFLEIFAGLADGSRTQMVLPLLYTVIVYHYTFARIGLPSVIVGTVLLVLVIAPLTTIYRTAYYEQLDYQGASVRGVVGSISSSYLGAEDWEYGNILDALTGRFSSLLAGALVVYDKVPQQIDFAKGGTFFPGAFVNFVPRLLWPDKPIIIPGREFAQTFWGVQIGELYATNMGIGWVGELYYNFGWFGLFLPIVLGVILRFFVLRMEIYSRIELNWMPRLYFVLFIIPAIGSFFYYPAGTIRSAIFFMAYLSFLNFGLPRVSRFR